MAAEKRCRACRTMNPARNRKCGACGRALPKKRRAAHMRTLDLPYETFLGANGGRDECGICGAAGKTRRLHRDHEHSGGGRPRGLLCFRCNAALRPYMTAAWLDAAAGYLRRAEAA